MESTSKRDVENIYEKSTENCLSLHEMFRVIGDQMTPRDIRLLKFLYGGIMTENIMSNVHDGVSFLLALEKIGRADETNFKHILHLLRVITRHDLVQYVTLRRKTTVKPDPVSTFLQESTVSTRKRKCSCSHSVSRRNSTPNESCQLCSSSTKKRRYSLRLKKKDEQAVSSTSTTNECLNSVQPTEESDEIKKRHTCDIRLRVRAQYCQHDSALNGITSTKPNKLEREFEKFSQAYTVLKARDLGSVICDIKFSELTYLDAFWRDYVNGSLLEALKEIFFTETLKQAVGNEAIKLLVNVDEDDYEAGRLKLLQNLKD